MVFALLRLLDQLCKQVFRFCSCHRHAGLIFKIIEFSLISNKFSFAIFSLLIYVSFQASAKSIRERFGFLNLLINASGILSIPDVLQPGTACVISSIRT